MQGRSRVLAAALVGLTAGLVTGWWLPRGPLTTAQALTTMVVGLVTGLLGGWLADSRWAMAVTPIGFALAYELVRLPTDGPTVDALRFTPYGVLALVVGRLFHGLLAFLPMLLAPPSGPVSPGIGEATVRTRRRMGGAGSAGSWAGWWPA